MTLLDPRPGPGRSSSTAGVTEAGAPRPPSSRRRRAPRVVRRGLVDDVAGPRRCPAAQQEWAQAKPEERAAVLRRAGQLFEEHAAEIEDWIVRESGDIPPKAGLETHIAARSATRPRRCPATRPARC